jgi:hypothetical protein
MAHRHFYRFADLESLAHIELRRQTQKLSGIVGTITLERTGPLGPYELTMPCLRCTTCQKITHGVHVTARRNAVHFRVPASMGIPYEACCICSVIFTAS